MATHSSILVWEIPWTEEPGGLQSVRSQKSWTQLSDLAHTLVCLNKEVYGAVKYYVKCFFEASLLNLVNCNFSSKRF